MLDGVQLYQKKLWPRCFLVRFPKLLRRSTLQNMNEITPTCLSEIAPKNVFTKSIHRKTQVMPSFLVTLQTFGLTVFSKWTPQ